MIVKKVYQKQFKKKYFFNEKPGVKQKMLKSPVFFFTIHGRVIWNPIIIYIMYITVYFILNYSALNNLREISRRGICIN